jgi:hypothetical protein
MTALTRRFFIATTLLGGILSSCQTSSTSPAESFTGEEANNAYQAWAAELAPKLQYPVQMHIDYKVEMAMDLAEMGENMDMNIDMGMDIICDSLDAIRTWGELGMNTTIAGEHHVFAIDFQLANDSNGLRFLMDDHGFIAEEVGMEIPKAYELSQDRLDILIDLYAGLMQDSMALYGPSVGDIWASIDGVGELFHPKNFTRFLTGTDFIEVTRWQKENGKISLLAKLDNELMTDVMALGMQDAGLPFDASVFDDMAFEIVIDELTGSLLDYSFKMDIPMEIPVAQAQSGVVTMDMGLDFRMQSLPVAADAPKVTLPEEGVWVLDDYFDQFLPVIEMAIDMQRAQIQEMTGEQDAGEDFSF